jgi:hypothetical protein
MYTMYYFAGSPFKDGLSLGQKEIRNRCIILLNSHISKLLKLVDSDIAVGKAGHNLQVSTHGLDYVP